MTINIPEAKTHFSRLVERASAGETIVLSRAGTPVAKLTRIDASDPPAQRRLGFLRGSALVPDDFDEWAAEDIAALFEGRLFEGDV